ncbi:NADH:ubiquinone reductase (Na(+)-transporting) subunit D [Pelagibacterium flavum]|uniref:NADH:ubiquinone reductase (Na(+)-transporting) subunit D n=1 Tax=Pelagibacterium flavum TaxID=2984530 RepID=A0ABY6IW51_9HYPH|nr:NADH:ubiquinone reductase (Na(+)-transporting) subunit D [Pelagibacterium sp. YIM 151497]UYQ70852.1 NADH:ubiquinone reductase (Na(+)-transporting) subunit D [Pelagibacterium sp. YIM 151497]UYQ73507.1 NADH:ubiquinone reductase (Na(+)-transporting) subunit D [Pelagibacterium sp. YIM 151497]
MNALRTLYGPIIDNNPVTLQILGICSALAVTTSMSTAAIMCLALTAVLITGSAIISLIRRHIPTSIRLIVQITIIASLVIVADQIIEAFAFEMSQRLSIFVGLIVTNCLVLGRAEAFAMHNPPAPSMLDALGNGLGYSLVLLIVGFFRELFGAGTLFGQTVFLTIYDGGWFVPLNLMLLAPSAFFVLGLLIWAIRSVRTAQVEPVDFDLEPGTKERAK